MNFLRSAEVIRLTGLALAAVGALVAQKIQSYEIQKPPGSLTGTLVANVGDHVLNVSSQAIRAWNGWNATVLLYTRPSGHNQGQALLIYDAPTARSRILTTEKLPITDITHVMLAGRENGFVISMRESGSKGAPWVALANERTGVYRREPYATPGPIHNDTVQIRHFSKEDIERAGSDLAILPPVRTSTVRLVPGIPSPLGTFVANLPAADAPGRKITLTVQPGGTAEMVTEYTGKGKVVQRGTWAQHESSLIVEFTPEAGRQPSTPLTWELTKDGLTPKTWDQTEYGSTGLPMKRAEPRR
jgi:hypothetical protein